MMLSLFRNSFQLGKKPAKSGWTTVHEWLANHQLKLAASIAGANPIALCPISLPGTAEEPFDLATISRILPPLADLIGCLQRREYGLRRDGPRLVMNRFAFGARAAGDDP